MIDNRKRLDAMTNYDFADEIIKWYSENIFPLDELKRDYARKLLEQWLWEEPQKKEFSQEELRDLFHDKFCGRGTLIDYVEIDRFVKELFK